MSETAAPTLKRLALLLFYPSKQEGDFLKCNLCKKSVKQRESRYKNPCTYICTNHSYGITKPVQKSLMRSNHVIPSLKYPNIPFAVYGCVKCIILCLLPLIFCENSIFWHPFKQKRISGKNFMLHMHKLSVAVEKAVCNSLLNHLPLFSMVGRNFDTHYVCGYATFPSSKYCFHDKVLLGSSPIDHGEILSANEHHEFLKLVLRLICKIWRK